MIVIYSDSNHVNEYWLPYLSTEYQCYNSITEFSNATGFKVAVTTCRYETHYDNNIFKTVEERIECLAKVSDLIFVIDYNFYYNEFDPLWQQFPQENIYWIVPGCLNNNLTVKDRVINYPGWFVGVAGLYRMIPELVGTVDPVLPKPLYFDALLGRPRAHRDYVYDAIINSDYSNKIVTTYLKSHDQMQSFLQNEFIWDKNCQPVTDLAGMQDMVMYHGVLVGLYTIIPIDLYNQTAYSIVTESTFDNRISFFTEKVAKPLLAKRLFILFSGAGSLKLLKKMGFKTFECVIDESYDNIEDFHERFAAAYAQVRRLCELNQEEVYNSIKDILEHNYNLLTQTNWDQQMINEVQTIINDKLK